MPVLTMSRLALANAIRAGRPPFLAVLGPPAVGKTAVLGEMRQFLPALLPDALAFGIDLRLLALGSAENMAADLERALYTTEFGSRLPAIPTSTHSTGEFLALVLLGMLRECHGPLVLFIDHLDAVPQYFARSIVRTIRRCFEASNSVEEYRRLGVVTAGAISLFELKRAADSAFTMFETLRLPILDNAEQRYRVEQRLAEEHLTSPREGVDAIVAETGGETSFLDVLLQALAREKPAIAEPDVRAVAERLSVISSRLPELRHLAISVARDSELREVVLELLAGRVAYPREPNVDIDRLQLSGAVVLTRENGRRAYRMRNGIVSRYLSAILAELLGTTATALSETQLLTVNPRYGREPVPDHQWVAQSQRAISDSEDLWSAMSLVQRAWSRLTTFATPELAIALPMDGTLHAWLIHSDKTWTTKNESERIAAASVLAARGARDVDRAYFAWSDSQVAVGVPLGKGRQDGVLVAALPRAALITGLSESSLCHWLSVVTKNGRTLSLLACETMYRNVHSERHPPAVPRLFASGTVANDPVDVFVAMPFASSLDFVYKDHIAKVCRKLHIGVLRGDDLFTAQGVMSDVFAAISRARVVVADCTGRNPNVFYEIGLAHSIDKTVILTTQVAADVPFDLQHLRFIQYEATPRGMREYEASLAATLRTVLQLKDP